MPKVLHPVGGRSMLAHVLDMATKLGASENIVVLGPELEDQVGSVIPKETPARTFIQRERNGTAHAVLMPQKMALLTMMGKSSCSMVIRHF